MKRSGLLPALLSNKLRSLCFLAVLSISVTTCVSIIELETSGTEEQIVIFGKVTNSTSFDQGFTVKRSDLETQVGLTFQDASIVVIDETTNVSYDYQYDAESDRFIPVVPYAGVPGHSYRARVSIQDQIFESASQRMPINGAQDTSYYRFEREEVITDAGAAFKYRLKVFTDSQIPNTDEPIFMRWDVEQVYILEEVVLPSSSFPFYSPGVCYVYDERFANDRVILFDGDVVQSSSIQGQEVADIPFDNSFINIRGYGIIQSSITREAANYWKNVINVSNREGSIFEVPPAPVPGNFQDINNPANSPLGFFEVAKVDTTGTFVLKGDIPVAIGRAPEFPFCGFPTTMFLQVPLNCFPCLENLGVPSYCWNCTQLPNSTRKRPSYLF